MPDESQRPVHERFSCAAKHYDQHAVIQRQSAIQMGRRIAAEIDPSELRAGLEIGCGTGFLTRELVGSFPDATWMVTDISPQMLAQCRLKIPSGDLIHYQILDGNAVATEGGPFDLICSNLSFQWFRDLSKTVRQLTELLTPGGRLVFNVLGQGSFTAWRAAHDRDADAPRPPQFPSEQDVITCLQNALRHACDQWNWRTDVTSLEQSHEGLTDFFRSLKKIGASTNVWNEASPRSGARFRWLRNASQKTVTMNYEIINVEMRRVEGA